MLWPREADLLLSHHLVRCQQASSAYLFFSEHESFNAVALCHLAKTFRQPLFITNYILHFYIETNMMGVGEIFPLIFCTWLGLKLIFLFYARDLQNRHLLEECFYITILNLKTFLFKLPIISVIWSAGGVYFSYALPEKNIFFQNLHAFFFTVIRTSQCSAFSFNYVFLKSSEVLHFVKSLPYNYFELFSFTYIFNFINKLFLGVDGLQVILAAYLSFYFTSIKSEWMLFTKVKVLAHSSLITIYSMLVRILQWEL